MNNPMRLIVKEQSGGRQLRSSSFRAHTSMRVARGLSYLPCARARKAVALREYLIEFLSLFRHHARQNIHAQSIRLPWDVLRCTQIVATLDYIFHVSLFSDFGQVTLSSKLCSRRISPSAKKKDTIERRFPVQRESIEMCPLERKLILACTHRALNR